MAKTLEEGDLKKIREKDNEGYKLELITTEDFFVEETFRERHYNCMACLKLRFVYLGQKCIEKLQDFSSHFP